MSGLSTDIEMDGVETGNNINKQEMTSLETGSDAGRKKEDSATEENTSSLEQSGYNPKLALTRAIEDWIPEFYQPKGSYNRFTAPNRRKTEESLAKDKDKPKDTVKTELSGTKCEEPASVGSMESSTSSLNDSPQNNRKSSKDSGKRKIEELEPLTIKDVQTLCDLFYLPFEHGSHGVYVLKEAHWLVQHATVIKDCYTHKLPRAEQVCTFI